jgi:hypothetical protein
VLCFFVPRLQFHYMLVFFNILFLTHPHLIMVPLRNKKLSYGSYPHTYMHTTFLAHSRQYQKLTTNYFVVRGRMLACGWIAQQVACHLMCALRIAYCVLRIAYCVLRIVYCVLRIAYCVLRIAYCVLRIAYCVLRIAYCILRIAYCILRIAYCVLRIAYCVLRIAYCVLRIACCVLCVACCVLRVAYCMLHCILHVAYCVLRVAYCVLRVACCVLRVACCVLRVACCVLRVAWCMLCDALSKDTANSCRTSLVCLVINYFEVFLLQFDLIFVFCCVWTNILFLCCNCSCCSLPQNSF